MADADTDEVNATDLVDSANLTDWADLADFADSADSADSSDSDFNPQLDSLQWLMKYLRLILVFM